MCRSASGALAARRRAFSLVEVAVATAVVSGMLVAAIDTVGAVAAARRSTADQTAGALRAQVLATEILSMPVTDPDSGAFTYGPAAGEADGTRSGFDSVGDYDGWRAVPQDRSGTKIAGMESFLETVTVSSVPAGKHAAGLASTALVFQVTVKVSGRGRTLGSLTFVCTAPAGTAVSGVPSS